jgi:hypothetical protein
VLNLIALRTAVATAVGAAVNFRPSLIDFQCPPVHVLPVEFFFGCIASALEFISTKPKPSTGPCLGPLSPGTVSTNLGFASVSKVERSRRTLYRTRDSRGGRVNRPIEGISNAINRRKLNCDVDYALRKAR